jgi:hypothetical protein
MGAETARFQAFATRREDDLPPPWQMRAPISKVGVLVGVLVVAVILAIVLGLVLGA